MIMPEKPPPVTAFLPDLFQVIGERVRLVQPAPCQRLRRGRRTMRHDKVHFPAGALQISSALLELCFTRHLFLPPGMVVHPEQSAPAAQLRVFPAEIRLLRVQNAVPDVMASGPAEGKQTDVLQLVHLAAHQMNDVFADILDLSTVPFLHRQLRQHIIILMIPVHPQKSEGFSREPFPLPFLLLRAVPVAKIAAHDDEVLPRHLLLLWKNLRVKPPVVPVAVSGNINQSRSLLSAGAENFRFIAQLIF